MSKILLMRYAHLFTSIVDRIIDVYEQNATTKSRERVLVLHRMSRISETILFRGTIAYLVVVSVHFINPIHSYFWRHEFKPLMPLYVPFVDERTAFGFVTLMSIQSFELFVGALANGCADFAILTFALNVWVFSTIFQENVIQLNGILNGPNADVPSAITKLRRIFVMYNENWM